MPVELRPKQPDGDNALSTASPPRKSLLATHGTQYRSTACVTCRRKKRKCKETDSRSCLCCIQEGKDCVFDGDSDGRRRNNRRSLKAQQQLLLRLLEAIKTCPEAELYNLAKAIQCAEATNTTLHAVLDDVSSLGVVAENGVPLATKPDTPEEGSQDSISTSLPSWSPLESHDSICSPVMPVLEHAYHDHVADHTDAEDTGRYSSLGAAGVSYNSPLTFAAGANHYSAVDQWQQTTSFERPDYLCTPNIVGVSQQTDPLTLSTLAFVHSARSRILAGEVIRDLLSMDGFDVELAFRNRWPSDPHTVSTWGCETTNTWPHFPLTVRLAMAYCLATFIRWLILPTRETWLMLSPMMRPLPSQLLVPHRSLWADLAHLPQLRTSQIKYGRSLENLLTKPHWASCNWPRSERDAIEMVQGRPRRLTEDFIRHVDDPQNWSLHESAVIEFPELTEDGNKVRLHDDRGAGKEVNIKIAGFTGTDL